jgi:tetratricopeptide (TPR) repeat protein
VWGPWTVLWLLLGSGVAHAQWIPDPVIDSTIQRGIDHIYNLEFYDANRVFDEVVRLRPEHPAGYFFRAMIQWWRILSNFDDESQDPRFYEMLQTVIDMCDRRLERHPEDVTALFFKGGALGFRGRLRVNRSSWIPAVRDGVAALPVVRKAFALEPDNRDVLLGMGIYNYYAEIIPDQYPIVKPFMVFLPAGNRKTGLEQLHVAAREARYARVEAQYFLLQTYFLYEKDYLRAFELARALHERYPKNPVFHRYLGRCYVTLGRWEEVFRVFTEVEERFRNRQIGYDVFDGREAHYYLGRWNFLRLNLDSARVHFEKCDELSRSIDRGGPSGFMVMANLTLGMVFDAKGDRKNAVAQYRKVLRMKEYGTSHVDARRYLETPYRRNW